MPERRTNSSTVRVFPIPPSPARRTEPPSPALAASRLVMSAAELRFPADEDVRVARAFLHPSAPLGRDSRCF
jgi:hypothetical protein